MNTNIFGNLKWTLTKPSNRYFRWFTAVNVWCINLFVSTLRFFSVIMSYLRGKGRSDGDIQRNCTKRISKDYVLVACISEDSKSLIGRKMCKNQHFFSKVWFRDKNVELRLLQINITYQLGLISCNWKVNFQLKKYLVHFAHVFYFIDNRSVSNQIYREEWVLYFFKDIEKLSFLFVTRRFTKFSHRKWYFLIAFVLY